MSSWGYIASCTASAVFMFLGYFLGIKKGKSDAEKNTEKEKAQAAHNAIDTRAHIDLHIDELQDPYVK